MPDCVKGVENEQRIITLEREQKKTSKSIDNLEVKIDEIKTRLLSRPTWAVTAIISVLTAITSISLTFALTVIKSAVFKIAGG